MVTIDWRGGENDGGGSSVIRIRENDGGGRVANIHPFTLGELPGWGKIFAEGDAGPTQPIIANTNFPEDGWDPAILIDDIALQFAGKACWKSDTLPLPPPEQSAVGAEEKFKADVDAFIAARAIGNGTEVKEEIRYQADDILSYFMKLASCSPDVRPETQFLLVLSLRIGAIVTRHYKRKFMRARPTQVMPWVDTVIPTPRHPAYPSGHAMQAYLMAKVVKTVSPTFEKMADRLADRIAMNRVLAGVHFPADGDASKTLVDLIWNCLLTVDGIAKRLDEAKKEH
jgi:hypothetical protein